MAEQMKPSGIDWIGDIPDKWDITKVRFVTKLRSEQGFYNSDDKYIGLENISSYTGEYISTESEYDAGIYDLYKTGDLLFSKLRPYLAKALIADDCGFCTGELAVIKEYNGDIRYLFYYMLSDGFLKMVDASTYGAKMPRASWDYIKNLQIPVIGKAEQQAIANFLDRECAQIDSIAADLEKQIALLQQYKKSLITETVTKGLDKSAPMKDSGVEWIGKIPEHWQKTRIKFEASIIGSGTTPDSGNSMYYDNGEHSWIQSGDLYGKDYIYETEKQLTNLAILECHALNWYTKDFVVVAMYGASVGNVAISKIDSFTNQACCVIKLNEKNDNRYLFYFLKAAQEEMLLKAFGGTQPNISQIIIKNLNFLNVPLLEQIEIADFLDSKCDMINEMLKSKKDQYDILIKHKKSLIYEYVTGKKRVKEVQ